MTKKSKKNRSKPAGDESSNAHEEIQNGVQLTPEDPVDVKECSSHQCSSDPLKDRVEELEKRLAQENDLREEIQSLRGVMLLKDDLREEMRALLQGEMQPLLRKDDVWEQMVSLQNETRHNGELRKDIESFRSEIQSLLHEEMQSFRSEIQSLLLKNVQSLRNEMQSMISKIEELQSSFTNLAQERDQAHSRTSVMESHVNHHQPLQVAGSNRTPEDSAAAAAVAEDSDLKPDLKLQQAASALMLEKLVSDNAELASKINKQIGMISQLTGSSSGTKSSCHSSSQLENDVILPAKGMTLEAMRPARDPFAEADNGALKGVEQVAAPRVEQVGAGDNDERRPYLGAKVGASNSDGEVQLVEETRVKAVPFTDAPLMGAPFRAISLLARFVSGADLVKSGG